jgi:hypothetical protein
MGKLARSYAASGGERGYNLSVFQTFDAGRSWHSAFHVDGPMAMSDPFVAFDRLGNAYVAAYGWHPDATGKATAKTPADNIGLLFKQRHGTRTWSGPAFTSRVDFQSLSVTGTGEVVITGMRALQPCCRIRVQLLRYPRVLLTRDYVLGERLPVVGHAIIVGHFLLVPYTTIPLPLSPLLLGDTFETALRVLRFDLVQRRFAGSIEVAPIVQAFRETTSLTPAIAHDDSAGPYHGRTYLAWPDYSKGYSDINIASSEDDGLTWSAPHATCSALVAQDNCPVRDRDMQAVAVNENGIVAIAWNDRRGQRGIGWRERFAISVDGGQTFLPSHAIASAYDSGLDVQAIPLATSWEDIEGLGHSQKQFLVPREAIGGGDSGTIATDSRGRFVVAWVDNRTGTSQVWTTSVTVRQQLWHDTVRGASVRDITNDVWVEFPAAEFMPPSQTIAADIKLYNRSKHVLNGEAFLRVMDASVIDGTAELLGVKHYLAGAYVIRIGRIDLAPGHAEVFGREIRVRLYLPGHLTQEQYFNLLTLRYAVLLGS